MDTPTPHQRLGLEFTERMCGFLVPGPGGDFGEMEARKPPAAVPFEFTVNVSTDDLDRMIEGPGHEAQITGAVTAPSLSGTPMTLSASVFTLFDEDPDRVETRTMGYRLRMEGSEGRKLFLKGFKYIREENMLHVWHDTTTLYITLHEGVDASGPVVGRGILHIEPADFLRELTTLKVTNAADKSEQLGGMARFGSSFAGVLWRHYGGIFVGPTAFDPEAKPRLKRPLRAKPPEFHPFRTEDGLVLQLTRYNGGGKGPVIVSPGLGVSSLIFSIDTIGTNLLEFLFERGYDVWLLDFRTSIALGTAGGQWDGDQVARYDYPGAVAKVREVTGAESVQFVVHCWGASTFFMAMLAGLKGVRSFVSSQIGAHFHSPVDVNLKTGLHVPQIFDALGVKSLDAYASTTESWWEKLYDQALKMPALLFAQGRCTSATCHRITFMYASLYCHEQLNEATHENLHELFGVGNMRSFEHIAAVGRAGHLVDFSGGDVYLPHLERLNLPIAWVHGGENHCFLPKGTEETFELLCSRFDPAQYSRHVIPGYGHIDCIFGKNASVDVFPHIVAHLDKTN